MGFALIPAILGEEAIGVMVAAGIADLVLIVSVALALASREGRGGEHWTTAVKGAPAGIGRNPLIWAIVPGLFASAFGIGLPFAIESSCGCLPRRRVRWRFRDRPVALHPRADEDRADHWSSSC